MYVIFPADEIVYLSYGHLIYVPSTPEPENQLRTPPIRTSLEESHLYFPSTPGINPYPRESIAGIESNKLVKSSKSSKSKEKPEKPNYDVYCIGSRAIDLESRETVDRIRVDGSTYESRGSSEQRENTYPSTRVDVSNRSIIITKQEPETSGSRSLNPESSFFLKRYANNRSIKTNNQVDSRLSGYKNPEFGTLEKNKAPNRSSNINQPEFPENLQTVEPIGSLIRFGTVNKPPLRHSQVEVDTRTQYPDSSNALCRSGTPNRSIKIKSPVETESFGSRTLEAEEYSTTNQSKSPSKFLRARETENSGSGTLERGTNYNSNKSSKSSKNSSSSSKSVGTGRPKSNTELNESSLRPRTVSDSVSNSKVERKKRLTSNSFRSFLRPSTLTKEKTPDPPVRPERKKDKKTVQTSDNSDRKQSYSDYLALNRDRVPRSDIINTRSDRIQQVREKPLIKREKSPVIKFFRAQSSSPKTVGRDRTAFDFDGFFKQEPSSPGKLSVSSAPVKIPPTPPTKSVPLKIRFGSDTNLAGRQSEKSPSKKKQFFQSVRGAATAKKIPAAQANEQANMAGNESPLKDLIHPSYNEHLKSHNAVSFKLIRTGRT